MTPDPQRGPRSLGDGLDVVRVTGRSMLPTLRAGDVLLVGARARRRPGAVAVVRLPGGRPLSVKRLGHHQDGGWWVERDNPVEGTDSWVVGVVPDADVLAVVLGRLWPRPRLLTSRGSHLGHSG